MERLSEQELDALVETIVAQSQFPPRAEKRLATILEGAPMQRVPIATGEVAAWRLGEGPALLLAHGANDDHVLWAPLMAAARARGRSVITFDMPGSGYSADAGRGFETTIDAVGAVADALGPVDTVMGHSVGSTAVIRALAAGLKARKTVLFAPALTSRWEFWILDRQINAPDGAPAVAIARAIERLDAMRLGPHFDFDVEALARGMRIPALMTHSLDDPHWSWRASETIAAAWPGARTHYADGLGHRGIARDADAIRVALDFVDEAA